MSDPQACHLKSTAQIIVSALNASLLPERAMASKGPSMVSSP